MRERSVIATGAGDCRPLETNRLALFQPTPLFASAFRKTDTLNRAHGPARVFDQLIVLLVDK